jgi:hypothetical protein
MMPLTIEVLSTKLFGSVTASAGKGWLVQVSFFKAAPLQ